MADLGVWAYVSQAFVAEDGERPVSRSRHAGGMLLQSRKRSLTERLERAGSRRLTLGLFQLLQNPDLPFWLPALREGIPAIALLAGNGQHYEST
jgi:hypothetical protein